MKFIKDNLYGFVKIGHIAQTIIDTMEFQRLRFIKQLGLIHFVFPNAHHTRFEHSIGVYHLINIFLDELSKTTDIEQRLKELIGIAGLIHDIGHVSFSHMFDHYIIPRIDGFEHEERAILLFTKMNTKYNFGFSKNDLELISNIILGIVDNKYPKYVFQIVANKKNELDLDKIDYLMRDGFYLGKEVSFDYKYLFNNTRIINDEIAFDVKTSFTIFSLFNMRYELHKKFYNHKTIILLETMVTDAIMSVFEELNLKDIFTTDKWLYELTDDLLLKLLQFDKSRPIIEKILSRKLYKLAPKDYDGEIIEISKHIGLTNKKVNPILKVNFYENENNNIITNLNMNKISIFKFLDSYEIEKFKIIRT